MYSLVCRHVFVKLCGKQEDKGGSHSLIPHAVSQYNCLPTAQELQDLQNPDCGSSLYEQDKTLLGMCHAFVRVLLTSLFPQVREILGQCSCPAQFPMIKVSEGKYKVGDSSALIFIRVGAPHHHYL